MEQAKKRFFDSLKFPFYFLVFLWAIHIFTFIFGVSLGRYGILPRSVYGIKGILTAPLIHADWVHITSNSVPLFVSSALIFFFYRKVAYRSFFSIYLFTGLAVWMFADAFEPIAFHIGASGVVYGLVSFVFWSGVFRRNAQSIILALIVLLLYSGMFYGITPQEGMSWESHLFGGIVGIIVAYIMRRSREPNQEEPEYSYLEESDEKQYFFDRNVFDQRDESEKQNRNQLFD